MIKVSKLDNYIFYSICEKLYESFKTTKFITFTNFCESLRVSIEFNQLGKKELIFMYEIDNYLRLIYNLSENETNTYISDFFILKKFTIFETSIRLMDKFFKNSFN